VKFETGDKLFSRQGFWLRIFPQMAILYTTLLGVGFFSIRDSLTLSSAFLVAGFVFLVVTAPQIFAYRSAARKHEQLKRIFGQKYVQLVETGKISLTPTSILMLKAPGYMADRLLTEEKGSEPKT